MSKDINIHLKTKGTQQAKRELDEAARSVENIGEKTTQTGHKTRTASEWIIGSLKKLAGPIGFMAIATAVAAAAGKIAKFFDDIKTRSDAAVRQVQEIRAAYDSLFEALDAFNEKSRQAVTLATNILLQKTGVTQELGLPVIDAYTRQFKPLIETGQITQQQYDQGLRETLTWAARHGGEATTELISIMRGWDMVTPQQQGEFRRMISTGGQLAGLTDEEVIGALGRGMPTIKAMGWTPEQAVAKITLLASGETGRKKAALPATTLEALMAPQLTDIEKLGIPEDVTKDPQKLLDFLSAKRPTMERQEYLQLLSQIYGKEAATGVYKLVTTPHQGLLETLKQTAGAEGIAAEKTEEEGRKGTLEYRDAVTKARKKRTQLDITEDESYMEDVREIGLEEQERYRRKQPFRQMFREAYQPIEYEKEFAAYLTWKESLSPEEREAIRKKYPSMLTPEYEEWRVTPAKQKWERLTRIRQKRPEEPFSGASMFSPMSLSPTRSFSESIEAEIAGAGQKAIVYNDNRIDNRRIFNPVVGVNREDLGMGPVVPRDLE